MPLEDCITASVALTTDEQLELGGMNPSAYNWLLTPLHLYKVYLFELGRGKNSAAPLNLNPSDLQMTF